MAKLPVLPPRHSRRIFRHKLKNTRHRRLYSFSTVNAKSASNIFARFQDVYQNDKYEVILIFCDTDKTPYREYNQTKKKINNFFGKLKAAEKIIIYANPCTMQIILSHFGDVSLKNQGKKTNANVIENFTGVKNYDAHKEQINTIYRKITRSTYHDMKQRVEGINSSDTTTCSTNFGVFLNRFENDDVSWIAEIKNALKKS